MRKFFIIAVVGLLSACAAMEAIGTDPTTTIAAIDTAYASAVSAEIVYLSSGKADKDTTLKLEAYRKNAHNVLAPLMQKVASGTPPTTEEALAAQAAVNILQEFITANKIGGSN